MELTSFLLCRTRTRHRTGISILAVPDRYSCAPSIVRGPNIFGTGLWAGSGVQITAFRGIILPSRRTEPPPVPGSGRPGSLLTLAPHRSGRAGSAASGSSTDGFATRRRVPAGPGSQAMATAIPKACLASSAIRCRDVETGPNLGVLAVFPSTGATCRCPLPSTGSRGLNSPASAVL